MFAKQTMASASFVVVIAGVLVESAHADPEDPPSGTFQVGAGYSSIEGFVAAARIEQPNLFGSGHYLALDTRISGLRQDMTLRYSTPDLGDGLSLSTELFTRDYRLPAFERKGVGGALVLQQRLSPNLRVFGGVKLERVSEPIDATLVTATGGMIYQTDRSVLGISYETSARRWGSDYNFDKVHLWGRRSIPTGPLTLHVGAQFTKLMGDVPISERLFLDGVTDLRGYQPGALASFGATEKFSGRMELEAPVWRRAGISVIGFTDVGYMGDRKWGATGLSTGFGIRWRSPIGVLRFDWAVPADGGETRFMFGFGDGWFQ